MVHSYLEIGDIVGELPLSAMDRIIRNATGLRVGLDARAALSEILEEKGTEIAREAGKFAKHAKRKTVKASDIKLALGK
jgi:histone H3/H4